MLYEVITNHSWQLSARHDDHSEFGEKGTYALAYGYQLTDTLRAQASYGTAFKAPSLYQLFSSWYGNANLKPEEARNREAALIWERGNHTASATWYRITSYNVCYTKLLRGCWRNGRPGGAEDRAGVIPCVGVAG